jgi:hypothetical protein
MDLGWGVQIYSLDKLLIISNESLDINIPNRA